MPRNIRRDESVKENTLYLVEALLRHEEDEFKNEELKALVYVEWVTENKLHVTGKKVKQISGKRSRTDEVGTKKIYLLKLVTKAGKSLKLAQRKKGSGNSQQERQLEEVQYILDSLRELKLLEEDDNTTKNKGYWKFTLTLKHQTATQKENLDVVRRKWSEHSKTKSLETSPKDNVTQTPDIEQQSNENKKLSYSDPLPDCTLFQGRQTQLEQIAAWLKNKEIAIIGIRGEGGIGKSTLAAKAFINSSDFTGRCWIDLETAPSITKVAEQALQEFGMSLEQMKFIEKEDLPKRLLRELQLDRYLLALDNLEFILTSEGEWLSGYEDFVYKFTKQCRPSVLLLAGREYPPKYSGWLNSEWLELETGLEPSEGAALLEALEAEGTKAERENVSVQVQGYPLALSLLAGWLRNTNRKGNRSVKHLDKQQNLFQIPAKHGSGNPISVEQVFDWSFERLCPNPQTLLTQVSVLRGAFNIEAAATLVQRSVEDEELQDLERRSLLQELPALDQYGLKLYRLQPRIREFAQKRAGDLTQAHERAIAYFSSQHRTNLDTATTQEDAKEYLETFHHQCELQRYQAAAQTIFACNDFLQRRGYFQLLVDHYTHLDTHWQPTLNQHQKEDYARLCFNLGIAYDSLGQYPSAIEYQKKSLEIRKDIGDPEGEASCWRNLGNAYTSLGEYGKAIEYQNESLKITKDIGDEHGKANSLGNLGNVYTSLKEYEQAIDYYKQSLEIIRKIDERQEEAKCLSNLGNVYTSLKEYEQAIEYQKKSFDITKEIGDRQVEAYCLGNLGNIYTSLKEYEQAISYYKRSLEIIKEIGDRNGQANCLFNLGNVYIYSKQRIDALQCLQQALEIYKDLQLNHEIEQCKAKIAQNNGSTPPL